MTRKQERDEEILELRDIHTRVCKIESGLDALARALRSNGLDNAADTVMKVSAKAYELRSNIGVDVKMNELLFPFFELNGRSRRIIIDLVRILPKD